MKIELFSSRLKQALHNRNITQQQLSEKTGIPKSAISQYVSGKFEPKQDRLELMANALEVSEEWLRGFDVPMTISNNSFLDEQFSKILSTLSDEDKEWLLDVIKSVIDRRK